jgi:hypothetical protein
MRGSVHTLVLVALGVPIFDNCDLEQLVSDTRTKRWNLLTTAPLSVLGHRLGAKPDRGV